MVLVMRPRLLCLVCCLVAVTAQSAQNQAARPSPDPATFAARAREAVMEELRAKNLLSPEIEVEMVYGPVEFPGDHVQLHRPQVTGQLSGTPPPIADWPQRFAVFAVWREGQLYRYCHGFEMEKIDDSCEELPQGQVPFSKDEWGEVRSELVSFYEDALDITRGTERLYPYLRLAEGMFDVELRRFFALLTDWTIYVVLSGLEGVEVEGAFGGSDFLSDFCSEKIAGRNRETERADIQWISKAISDDLPKRNQALREIGALDPSHLAVLKPYLQALLLNWQLTKEGNSGRIESLPPSTILYGAHVVFSLRFARLDNRLQIVSVCSEFRHGP